MLYGYGVLFVVELCLLVFCVLSIISTPESEVQHLPKTMWLILVIILPLAGGIAWLVLGRAQATNLPYKGNHGDRRIPPEYDRPGRASAYSPDDDEAFLRQLRDRSDQQRKAAEQQRKAELEREAEQRKADQETRRARGQGPVEG